MTKLGMARVVVLAVALSNACAPAIGVSRPAPFPGSIATRPARPDAVSSVAALDLPRLIQSALGLRGTPYQLGGDSPATGFDCSGLVRYLLREQGWELPRTVREQYEYGHKVRERDIQPGDLLFFSTESRGATHVGIVIDHVDAGTGRAFIHAPGNGGSVRIDVLETPYWRSRFVGARRLF